MKGRLTFKQVAIIGLVGAGLAVIKGIVYRLLQTEDRPPIRVRNGSSISVTVDRGDFTPSGGEWYSDAPGKVPSGFTVTLSGTECDGTTPTTTPPVVRAWYRRASSPQKELVVIELKPAGGATQAFVTPPPMSTQRSAKGKLVVRGGQPWKLSDVQVGDQPSCAVTSDDAEICIEQTPKGRQTVMRRPASATWRGEYDTDTEKRST